MSLNRRKLKGRALRCVGDSVRRRKATPGQHVGAEVRAARPHQGPALHAELSKSLGVPTKAGKNRPREEFLQVALDYPAIRQLESNAEALKRRGVLNAYQVHAAFILFQRLDG